MTDEKPNVSCAIYEQVVCERDTLHAELAHLKDLLDRLRRGHGAGVMSKIWDEVDTVLR